MEQDFSYLQLFFHIITTIRYALLPAMNKSLYAALVKVCTSRGKPLSYSCNDSTVVGKCCPRNPFFIGLRSSLELVI
jgi:hypothetical protein